MAEAIKVAYNSNCRYFARAPWSLIEEPDWCEVCSHYQEPEGLCTCKERIAEEK